MAIGNQIREKVDAKQKSLTFITHDGIFQNDFFKNLYKKLRCKGGGKEQGYRAMSMPLLLFARMPWYFQIISFASFLFDEIF